MVSFSYTVRGAQGLHARPVVEIAQIASTCQSAVTVACNGSTADASDMMGLMAFNARRGDTLEVTVDGPDEQAVAESLRAVFTF